jgi:ATP-binding cassette subfamily B protein
MNQSIRHRTVLSLNWRLIKTAPVGYLLWSLGTIGVSCLPIVLGLVEKRFFDTLSGAITPTLSITSLIAVIVGLGIGQLLLSLLAVWGDIIFRYTNISKVSQNLVATQFQRPGAQSSNIPLGETLSRYRSDIGEITDFPLWLPYVLGYLIAFVIAVIVMVQINLTITLVLVLPFLVMGVFSRLAWSRLLQATHQSSQANDQTVGFLTHSLDALQAIRIAAAEQSILGEFQRLSKQRAASAIRAYSYNELLQSFNQSSIMLGTGLILGLAGLALQRDQISLGDLTLFMSYLTLSSTLPSLIGSFIGDYQQQFVAISRLQELNPEHSADVIANGPPTIQQADYQPLQQLELCNLSYQHNSQQGIFDINLRLPKGTKTVIIGRNGSGKTTLIRSLLGLLPAQQGHITWNGQVIENPNTFFQPPMSSYTSQIPQLLSLSLQNNILLGQENQQLDAIVQAAELKHDLNHLEQGLETMVGPRGVRLSGGQVQRTALARMLAHPADLLVFDDHSSALDRHTEQKIWQHISDHCEQHQSCCVFVSHQNNILQQADQIVVLKAGRIEAIGKYHDLLQSSPEFQQLVLQTAQPHTNGVH